MKVYTSFDPNIALKRIVNDITVLGEICNSRNGETIAFNEPVCIEYPNPRHRVIWLHSRRANPYFHIFEFIWMLEGRQDVASLAAFNSNMRSFSDDGLIFNAPYGYRLRHHFGHDQLAEIADMIKKDPDTRQAVALLWDHNDLTKNTKDKACNLELVFKVRDNRLDMTVFNRSNDLIWGAMGANLVHMSFFHEYMAYKTGYELGRYSQITNCLHVYLNGPAGDIYRRILHENMYASEDYSHCYISEEISMEGIEDDTHTLFSNIDSFDIKDIIGGSIFPCGFKSEFFNKLFIPMMMSYYHHKKHEDDIARSWVDSISNDWKLACNNWLDKR